MIQFSEGIVSDKLADIWLCFVRSGEQLPDRFMRKNILKNICLFKTVNNKKKYNGKRRLKTEKKCSLSDAKMFWAPFRLISYLNLFVSNK